MYYSNLFLLVTFLALSSAGIVNREPEMDSRCKGKSFCIYMPSNYPQGAIEKLLEEANWNEIDTQVPTSRGGEPKNVCKTIIPNTSYVYMIRDTNGDLRYVVQSKKFKQVVRIVECEYPGRINATTPIMNLSNSIDIRNKPVGCRQGTTDFKFLVMSKDLTKFEVATPQGGVPTCCAFVYYK